MGYEITWECKLQKQNKTLFWISANRPFGNRAQDTKWNLPTKTVKNLSINRYTSCVPESYCCYYMLAFFFSVNVCNKLPVSRTSDFRLPTSTERRRQIWFWIGNEVNTLQLTVHSTVHIDTRVIWWNSILRGYFCDSSVLNFIFFRNDPELA